MTDSLSSPPIILETGANAPDSCIIWLHGLGADGQDFEAIVPELNLNPALNLRFIFPHAPKIAVTINQGYVMRAWYDIISPDIAQGQDENGIRASEKLLVSLIQEQIAAGIPASRIVLAGFSQGGVIALQTGLRFKESLAGIMALSTYLPLADTLAQEKNAANAEIPIFLAHGSVDTVIPLSLAYKTREQLQQQGYQPEWFEYNGLAHGVSGEEISDIARWLEARFI